MVSREFVHEFDAWWEITGSGARKPVTQAEVDAACWLHHENAPGWEYRRVGDTIQMRPEQPTDSIDTADIRSRAGTSYNRWSDHEVEELCDEVEQWRKGELGCHRRPLAGETIDGPCPDCGRARGMHRR